MVGTPRRRLLRLDPLLDSLLQQVQWHRSAVQDFIVERLDVELRSELRFGFIAQLANSQLPHFIGQRLSRPGDVTVGLGLRQRVVQVVSVHVIDHLLAAPLLVVNAGINHQPNSAKKL